MTLTLLQALILFGFLGSLAGAFALLFHLLVATKNERIKELVGERDYYRSAALFERELPGQLHPAALPPGTPQTIIINKDGDGKKDGDSASGDASRFSYYSLFIQAGISIVIIIGAFWLIAQPTDPTANQVAYQLLSFVVGVWLGRGADYAQSRVTKN